MLSAEIEDLVKEWVSRGTPG